MTTIDLETFGKGKPIVLVHGWAMHAGIWREFARQLALNYQVTCINLPGHGHSEKIDPFTLERISAELGNVIPEQSCWLGWSFGATVVLDIASRYPDRVSALVLLAGNPSFVGATPSSRLDANRDEGVAPTTTHNGEYLGSKTQTEQWPGMDVRLLDDFAGQLTKDCPATLLRFLSLQVNGLPDQKALLKVLRAAIYECDTPDKHTLQGGLEILKQADMRPVLAELKMPVSVILGSLDSLVPVAVGQKMQQLLPSLELNILDRAGHVPFLSHGRETLAIISRFMDQQCI